MRKFFEDNAMRKSGTTRATNGGFSLIELMVAVVILGILAGVAYPSYQRYVAQARRTDATINLMRIAALQEKFFITCNSTYAANFGTPQNCATGTLSADLSVGNTTPNGHYTIAVAPGPTGNIATSFALTATPAGTQASYDAAHCTNFAINNTGVKSATGSDSLKCWKN